MLDQFIVGLFPLLPTITLIGFVAYLSREPTETAVLLTIAAILAMLFRPSDQLHYNTPPTIWLRVHHGLMTDGCWSLVAVLLMSLAVLGRSMASAIRNANRIRLMTFRLKPYDIIAIVYATILAAFAVWMNVPDYRYRYTDTTALWEWFDDETPYATPDVYLNTGFPFHYHRVKLLPGGKTTFFRETPGKLWLNTLLCLLGVAGAFLFLRTLRFSLWGMFLLVSLSAVLFWADSQFVNLSYFYVIPTIFFLPAALSFAVLVRRWVASTKVKTAFVLAVVLPVACVAQDSSSSTETDRTAKRSSTR